MKNNAYGVKINGSGGGGCCFVYAAPEHCDRIIEAMESLGYPGRLIEQDTGVRVEETRPRRLLYSVIKP